VSFHRVESLFALAEINFRQTEADGRLAFYFVHGVPENNLEAEVGVGRLMPVFRVKTA
jgi:hypothetical protein